MRTALIRKSLPTITILLLLSYPFIAIWIPTVTAPGIPKIIVTGEVKNITSKTEGALIYSYVSFFVAHVKNGSASLKNTEITIRCIGGAVGRTILIRSDEAYFYIGEKAQLTLEEENEVFRVVGGRKGKAKVDENLQPITQRTAAGYMLTWFHPTSGFQASTYRPGSDWYGPLKWSDSALPVVYYTDTRYMPSGISEAAFVTHARQCYQNWKDDPGSYIDYTYGGIKTDVEPGANDGFNMFAWRNLGGAGGTLGVAQTWCIYVEGNYDSLRILDSDISLDFTDAWSAADTCPPDRFDVQNVGTHEVGHTAQLADLYDGEDSAMTMYGYSSLGQTSQRSLEWGDQAGIRYLYPSSLLVQITVTSSPTGSGLVAVDGADITTPLVFFWLKGSSHTLAANSPVSGAAGIRYVWTSWSDGGVQSHSITVPSNPTTYTANFKKQDMLTVSVSPPGAGTLSVSTGWQDDGTTVSISATANTGYSFYYWSLDGVNIGSNPSCSVVMNSPHSLTAYFRGTSVISLGLSSASISLGSAVTLSGAVTPTQPSPGIPSGTTVLLSYSLDGSTWSTFIMTQTAMSGAYSVVWYPPYCGSYQIKATWNGNSDYQSSTSSTVTLAVTGTSPPRITILISGPSLVAKGGSATFDVLADNPGSSISTTLYFEVTGPRGYRYFDTQQVMLGAGKGRFQFIWEVSSTAGLGQYQVFVGLIPPKSTAMAQAQITVQ